MTNWIKIYKEEDLRKILGDFLLDDLLELMSFERLEKWLEEPNEHLGGETPIEIIKNDGVEHIEDLVANQKFNNYN